jgi:hypothetical protein
VNLNATLVAQLVVFFILAWFTMKFVWPPIVKALDERAKKIADGLAAADKAKSDLAHAEKKVVEELRKARESATDVRASAEKQAAASSSMKLAPKPPASLPRPVKPPKPKLASPPNVPRKPCAIRSPIWLSPVPRRFCAGDQRSGARRPAGQPETGTAISHGRERHHRTPLC